VLHDFIATFHGPLPAHIIDAMSSVIFNLDDDNSSMSGQRWQTWNPLKEEA
jgi:hypothetical protein